jgi:hypothetical protein
VPTTAPAGLPIPPAGKVTPDVPSIVIAIIHRADNDDDKLVVAPNGIILSDEEISKLVNFQEKWFKSSVVRK